MDEIDQQIDKVLRILPTLRFKKYIITIFKFICVRLYPYTTLDFLGLLPENPIDINTLLTTSLRNCIPRHNQHDTVLTPNNYKDYFYKLISLDEKSAQLKLKCYNMKNVSVIIREQGVIELEVPGLAEKRPSIIRGDTITFKKNNGMIQYTGTVKDVHDKDIWVHQISSDFINQIRANPTCVVDVEFDMNRYCYDRKYSALGLFSVEQILDILLPTIELNKPNKILNYILTDDHYVNISVKENAEQKQAVMNILNGTSGKAPYIVFGPPGTGKSVTIVEAIIQIVRLVEWSRVLVCAPTNAACDALVGKLAQHFTKQELIRIHSQTADWKSVPDIVKEYSNRSGDTCEKVSSFDLLKYKVVVTTLMSIGRYSVAFKASHVFIDEAAQAMEPEALIAIGGILSKDGQVVLAGDPKQLGPICNCQEPEGRPLGISLLARLMDRPLYTDINKDSHFFITKLVLNYRNHPDILHLPNKMFYDAELRAVSCIPIDDEINKVILPVDRWGNVNAKAVEFYGVNGQESRDANSPSYYNELEIKAVLRYLYVLIESEIVQAGEIGVITPYIKQVHRICSRLPNKLKNVEVGTAETFQGREKRVIIISTVRAQKSLISYDQKCNIGFVQNPERFNVAVTRAISKLIIIGNPHCLASNDMWLKMINFCQVMGSYRGCSFTRKDDASSDNFENNFINFAVSSLPYVEVVCFLYYFGCIMFS